MLKIIIIFFFPFFFSKDRRFEKFHIPQDSQECECGELKTLRHILMECVWYDDLRQKLKRECSQLETVEHILKECPLHPAEREVLRKISPELDLKILLDTKKGLDAVVKFLDYYVSLP